MEKEESKIQSFLSETSKIVSDLKALKLDQFTNRIHNLEQNINSFSVHTIKSGLVGITSSGKSSVLNILLGTGTKILKEQSKATTNMLVFCSKASEPTLEIMFEDEKRLKKTGDEVLQESIWKYSSEDENPGNKYSIKYIKLGLPSFMLGDNIELADTPGLDAYGLKEHEDLTLREFLPQADLIIYLSSIRSPMKEADRKILNKIMDADQKIIFVQTCKGAVVDSSLGRDASDTIESRLDSFKEDFEKLIRPYASLKDAPIAQVETTTATQYFKNKDNAVWAESGFEELIYIIKAVAKQLQYEYTIRNLRKVVDEVNALIALVLGVGKAEAEKKTSIEEQIKKLDKYKKYYERIKHTKEQVVTIWSQKMDYNSLYTVYERELSRMFASRYDFNYLRDTEFTMKTNEIGEKMYEIKASMLDNLDNARNKFKEYFDDLGLDVRRTDIQNTTVKSFFLPNMKKRRVSEAVGSSAKSLLSKSGESAPEYIDKSQFIKDLKGSMEMFFMPLIEHLQWWDKTVTTSFVEPLTKKISSIEDDITNIDKVSDFDKEQYRKLMEISKALHSKVREVADLCSMEFIEQAFPVYTKKTYTREKNLVFTNLFLQMCNRFYESMFHNYYFKKISGLSANDKKTIILTDQSFAQHVNFLSRLLRIEPEDAGRLRNLTVPYVLNPQNPVTDIDSLTIKGEFSDSLTFFVIGNNEKSLSFIKSGSLFEQADVIQVMIDDLHRVGSALVDLVERNQFFDFFKTHKNKLLMTYSGGAYFQKNRLHIMVVEAIAEINKIFGNTDIHWFIYEGYEIRYNYFYEIAGGMTPESSEPEDCLKIWKNQCLPLDEPFTEDILLEQFAELSSAI
ncbi:MAG: dynamin family protein [Nitrospirae bacterium YQR-1]